MYYLFGILLLPLCLLALLRRQKKKALCRLACMSLCERHKLLDSIAEPLGYLYVPQSDVFTSRTDAWQRAFGYAAFYDRAAPFFHMVFDTLPIYFDHDGKTWLVQVWKGQYGLHTGCEIGLYHANGPVRKEDRGRTVFHVAEEHEWMDLSLSLWREGRRIASFGGKHWWLTAFSPGSFSQPSQLSLEISIRFPNREMKHAFYRALLEQGAESRDVFSYHSSVFFHFPDRCPKPPLWKRPVCFLAQWANRASCQLFHFATRQFQSGGDRILYLYLYLPFVCRRLFMPRRFRCGRKCGRKGGRHGI